MPHLTEETVYNPRTTDWWGAGLLPGQIDGFKKTIPPRVYEIATAIKGLHEKIHDGESEIKDLEDELRDAEKDAKRADSGHGARRPHDHDHDRDHDRDHGDAEARRAELERHRTHVSELRALLEAASSQLENDMSTAQNKYAFQAAYGGRYYTGVSVGYTSDRNGFRECAGTFTLPYQNVYYGFCAVIDLTTGQTNYELDSTGDPEYSSPVPVAFLGTATPAEAGKNGFVFSRLRHGLRRLQIQPMPEICKDRATSKFDALAEAEGGPKSAPAPTIEAASAVASSKSGSRTALN